MASSALFLWPPPSSSPAQETSLLDPEPKETTPPLPKPKPKRGGKGSPATKKIPQRGLGVAQLERIRLLERIKKLSSSTDEIWPFPVNIPLIFEQQQAPPICYVPQYRIGGQGVIGYGPVSAVQSVLHEQYTMDRFRIGSGSLVSAELPSNQRAAAGCVVSDHHCEFCARKKLLMRENQLGFYCGNGVDPYFLMDEERRGEFGYGERMMGGFVKEREIKEYEFFPHNSSGGSNGGHLELGEQMVGAPSSSSSSSSAVDLSLKLF